MPFDFGEVVLVPFPFTDQAASKRRPAIVVSSRAYNEARPDVVVMAVTSQVRPGRALGEVWVRRWRTAGLLKPSAIEPVFATLEQALVIRRLDTLEAEDQAALKKSHRRGTRIDGRKPFRLTAAGRARPLALEPWPPIVLP